MCRGSLIGHPVENIRVVITDGAAHAVDSSELAFKLAAIYAFRKVCLICILWDEFNANQIAPISFLFINFFFCILITIVFNF